MIKIQLSKESLITDFHYQNLCGRLTGKQQNVLQMFNKYLAKYKHIKYYHDRLTFLKSKTERDSSGFSILTAKPDDLHNFIVDFKTRFPQKLTGKFKNVLACIFYYGDHSKWKAYELGRKININVCPYCNRSYTFIVGNDISKGTRFEYDHFFSQELYPYLALSFYNLVPSCHICNANLKLKKEFTLQRNIHPYKEGFGDELLFSLIPKSINFMNGVPDAYTIKFKAGIGLNFRKARRAFYNIRIFRLEELYNMHSDYVDDIIKKAQIYNNEYVDTLFTQFGGKLFRDKGEIKQFIVGNYLNEADFSKSVLSKLSRDIAAELDLI